MAVTIIAFWLVFELRTQGSSSSRGVDRARERCSSDSPPLLDHTRSHSLIAPRADIVRWIPSVARPLLRTRCIAVTSCGDSAVLIEEVAKPTDGCIHPFHDCKMRCPLQLKSRVAVRGGASGGGNEESSENRLHTFSECQEC